MASLALHLKSHPHKPSQTLLKSSTFSLFFSSSSNNNNNDNNNNNNIPSDFSDLKSRLQQQPPFRGGADGGGEEDVLVKHYPFSTSLTDVKAKLKQREQQQQSQGFRPSIFGSNTSPSGSDYNDKIRRNLSEFRSRAASGGGSPLEKRTQAVTFQDIKESLSMIRKSVNDNNNNNNNKGKNMINSMSFNSNLSSFKPQQGATMPNLGGGGGGNVLGGSALPVGVFGKEMNEKEMKKGQGDGGGGGGGEEMWMRGFDFDVLGKKLRELRPEVKGKKEKGEGFSISELNERLMKVKENAKKESADSSGLPFLELKRTLQTMLTDAKTNTNTLPIQGLDILGPGTPSFMLSPPKEHLVEKYFHPDNLSAAEKLKLELEKVRDEFKIHESDCGSTRVQIAQLTTEILHLSSVLLKKDKHSRRGLQAKVQQRKKLLKYLRRTDWESYCFVLSKLGLRDNPDYKN